MKEAKGYRVRFLIRGSDKPMQEITLQAINISLAYARFREIVYPANVVIVDIQETKVR